MKDIFPAICGLVCVEQSRRRDCFSLASRASRPGTIPARTFLACKRRVAQGRRINKIHPALGRADENGVDVVSTANFGFHSPSACPELRRGGRVSRRAGIRPGEGKSVSEDTTQHNAKTLPARSSRPSQREGEASDYASTLNTYPGAPGLFYNKSFLALPFRAGAFSAIIFHVNTT